MKAAAFLRDLEAKPATLRALAADLAPATDWGSSGVRRVVLIGMGSSRYAARVAAVRLRAAGVDAVAELASLEAGTPPGPDVLAVGISASGGTAETVEALARHRGRSRTVALTNRPEAPIAEVADRVVAMRAGEEAGGVACRTFQHTSALLLELEAALVARQPPIADRILRAAEAVEDLLERRDRWLPGVADLLGEGPATFTIAPAERSSSADQGALMFREGPRRIADACESGDWLHVDVYLTRPLAYRALLFAGSRFDDAVMAWMRERGGCVVGVGADVPGATLTVRHRHDDVPEVALLTEVLVAELVAARWWLAQDDEPG